MPISAKPSPAAHKLPCSTHSPKDLTNVHKYNKKYLGEDHFDTHAAALGESFLFSLSNLVASTDAVVGNSPTHDTNPSQVTWCASLPSHIVPSSCII